MSMLDGIDRTAREQGYQILISNTDLAVEREIESIYSLMQNKVAGIILIATEITPQHLEAQEAISVPILFIGQNHADVFRSITTIMQRGRSLLRIYFLSIIKR